MKPLASKNFMQKDNFYNTFYTGLLYKLLYAHFYAKLFYTEFLYTLPFLLQFKPTLL